MIESAKSLIKTAFPGSVRIYRRLRAVPQADVDNFKRSNSFLLATTDVNVPENEDTQTGGWRSVNLQVPPFNFPPPLRLITEDSELGKCLELWRLEEL